jgi:hypothetical protein
LGQLLENLTKWTRKLAVWIVCYYSNVVCIISLWMSTIIILSCHRWHIFTEVVIIPAYFFIRVGWNAGCIILLCLSWYSPSLVTNPSPNKSKRLKPWRNSSWTVDFSEDISLYFRLFCANA